MTKQITIMTLAATILAVSCCVEPDEGTTLTVPSPVTSSVETPESELAPSGGDRLEVGDTQATAETESEIPSSSVTTTPNDDPAQVTGDENEGSAPDTSPLPEPGGPWQEDPRVPDTTKTTPPPRE